MNSAGIEILLELGDGAVDQPAARADMEPHIVALGGDPLDVRGGDPDQAAMVRHPEFLDMGRRPAPRRARRAAGEMGAHPLERALEPVGLDRLHQIVDRGDVEGGDREIVERGDEHHRRIDRRLGQRAGDVDPVHAGHGDVEQHQVGRHRLGDPQRRLAVIGGADDDRRRRSGRAAAAAARPRAARRRRP